MPHYGDNREPVLTEEFPYPEETETANTSQTPFQIFANGFRAAFECLVLRRGAKARNLRIEAYLWIVTESGETITSAARRLKVSRETFSREVQRMKNLRALIKTSQPWV